MSVASPAPRVSLSLGGGLLRFAAPSTGDPGSRRGPLGYARDLAPARCRFRSTRFLPRSTGRLVDPPAAPYGTGILECPGEWRRAKGASGPMTAPQRGVRARRRRRGGVAEGAVPGGGAAPPRGGGARPRRTAAVR